MVTVGDTGDNGANAKGGHKHDAFIAASGFLGAAGHGVPQLTFA